MRQEGKEEARDWTLGPYRRGRRHAGHKAVWDARAPCGQSLVVIKGDLTVHCTPMSEGGWIDSGRWRRGHRLALLGVMTLTQCSAMASHLHLQNPHAKERGEAHSRRRDRERARFTM